MVSIGMIFQFNNTQGTGLIMLSDGEKKEFSTDDWVDASNLPKIGLEIVYEINDNRIKIKVPSEEEKNALKNKTLPGKKTVKEESDIGKKEDDITGLTSLEEYQTYFSNKGFDVIKNTQETVDDELTMGKFSDESVETVSISFKNSKPELTKKTIHLSSVDDHIKYFKDIGYKVINDSDRGDVRQVMLRKYVMDKHGEIRIKYSDSKISVTQTINGKKVG